MKAHKGFTLIELLITSVLLSAIIFVGTLSYSLFASNWQRNLSGYQQTVSFSRDLESLRKVLASTYPQIVGGNGENALYLFGESTSLRATSHTGFFVDQATVYRLEVQENQEGIKQLVYLEVKSNDVLVDSYDQQFEFAYRRVIIDHLVDMDIQYFGWENAIAKNSGFMNSGREVRRWFSSYDSEKARLFPEKIKIHIDYLNNQQQTKTVEFYLAFSSTPESGLNVN